MNSKIIVEFNNSNKRLYKLFINCMLKKVTQTRDSFGGTIVIRTIEGGEFLHDIIFYMKINIVLVIDDIDNNKNKKLIFSKMFAKYGYKLGELHLA